MDMAWIVVTAFGAMVLAVRALWPAPSIPATRLAETQIIGERPSLLARFRGLLDRTPRLPRAGGVSDFPILRPRGDRTQTSGVRRGFLSPLLIRVSKVIRLSDRQTAELANQLSYVGSALSPQAFIGLKLLSAALWCAGCALLLPAVIKQYPVLLALALLIGFVTPDVSLRSQLARRHKAIVRLLPEVVDLLSLCMGAGLDFLGALNRVITVKGTPGGKKKEPLLEELSVVMQEIKLGKRRSEALRAMGKRVSLPELSSFVRMLVQADRMGTPIAEVLVANAEDIRFERYNRAEKAALKAPIKILVPLIFCILPCVAIIVAAPIFLQFMKQGPLLVK